MNAGALDQRVIVERQVGDEYDDYGQLITTWTPLATVWAAVEPLNGREYFAANTTLSETTARIRTRYRPDLIVTDRINHEGTVYNINSIINPRSENRELVLMCRAVG